MFVIVRYGDDQQQIVNTNCKIAVFLDYIKTKCGCTVNDIVDLSDEKGQVKNLREHPKDCARKYLRDRETLVVLKVYNSNPANTAGKPNTGRTYYTPLLLSLASNKEFNETLNPRHEEETGGPVMPRRPSRRRSFTFENDESRRARSKSRSSWSSSGKKSSSRRGRKV